MDDISEPLHVEIRLDPNGVKAPLMRTLSEVADHAALGLHAIQAFRPSTKLMLPTDGFSFGFVDPMLPITDSERVEAQERFTTWILLAAFQAFIKGASAALKEAHIYITIASQGTKIATTTQVLNDLVANARNRADKDSFPQLLERVTAGLTRQMDLADHLISFNAVRNCLEHRGGVVRGKDVTDEESGALVLKWRRMVLFWTNPDGEEVEVRMGSVVSGDIMMRVEDRAKRFLVGDRVSLSIEEFSEAMFTASLMAQDLAEKLPVVGAPPARS